jgi:hypothetical protein
MADMRLTGIILVDPPIPLYHNGRGPFSRDNMLRLWFQYLPEDSGRPTENSDWSLFDHISSTFIRRRPLLHDSDKVDKASEMLNLLIGYIILETWQQNVQYLERCLQRWAQQYYCQIWAYIVVLRDSG